MLARLFFRRRRPAVEPTELELAAFAAAFAAAVALAFWLLP